MQFPANMNQPHSAYYPTYIHCIKPASCICFRVKPTKGSSRSWFDLWPGFSKNNIYILESTINWRLWLCVLICIGPSYEQTEKYSAPSGHITLCCKFLHMHQTILKRYSSFSSVLFKFHSRYPNAVAMFIRCALTVALPLSNKKMYIVDLRQV